MNSIYILSSLSDISENPLSKQFGFKYMFLPIILYISYIFMYAIPIKIIIHPPSPLHLQRLKSQHHKKSSPLSSLHTPVMALPLRGVGSSLYFPHPQVYPFGPYSPFFYPLVVGCIISWYCFLFLPCTCFASLSICTVGNTSFDAHVTDRWEHSLQ